MSRSVDLNHEKCWRKVVILDFGNGHIAVSEAPICVGQLASGFFLGAATAVAVA